MCTLQHENQLSKTEDINNLLIGIKTFLFVEMCAQYCQNPFTLGLGFLGLHWRPMIDSIYPTKEWFGFTMQYCIQKDATL